MHKVLKICITMLALSSPSFADSTNLKQALEHAYVNNPSLQAARAGLKAVDEGVVQARAGLYPTVSGTYGINVTNTGSPSPFSSRINVSNVATNSASLTISQLIYDGGRTKDALEAVKTRLFADRESLVSTEQSVLLSVVRAYMDVNRAQAELELTQNNVRVLREQVNASKDRFEVGEVTRTDVSQSEARLASAISLLEADRADLRAQQANYLSIVGKTAHRLSNTTRIPSLPKSVAEAERIARQSNPDIKAARLVLEASELEILAASKNRIPTVRGEVSGTARRTANLGGAYNDPTTTASIGLTATIPIYQGGALKSARRSAIANRENLKATLNQVIAQVTANVRSDYAAWISARAAINANQEQIRAAEIAFEGVREEAKVGARTTLDVLDAEQELLTARSNLLTARRNEQVAAYAVLNDIGKLTPSGLNFSVPAYDPKDNFNKVMEESALGSKRLKLLRALEKRR